jgi:hypothetical protein
VTTTMIMMPLPNYNQQGMLYQTKIQQVFVAVGMLDELNQTLISLLSLFNPSHTIFNIQFAIRLYHSELPLIKRIINRQCIYFLASRMEWL